MALSETTADCTFCRIAAHEAPATATPLHVLVVPRRHIRSVAELAEVDLAGRLVLAATRIALDAGERGSARA